MEELWIASHVALWLLVLLELLFIIALARQIGLLSVRVGPAGARMMNPGPQIGDPAPSLEVTDIFSRQVTLGIARGKRTLLVFLSLRCPNCREILPGLKTLHRTEKDSLETVLITSTADVEASRNFVQEHGLIQIPFVASDDLGARYQVGVVPYAVMVDREGRVRAKGLVNNLADLESLLNAEELRHPSIESLLQEHRQHLGKPEALAQDGNARHEVAL